MGCERFVGGLCTVHRLDVIKRRVNCASPPLNWSRNGALAIDAWEVVPLDNCANETKYKLITVFLPASNLEHYTHYKFHSEVRKFHNVGGNVRDK